MTQQIGPYGVFNPGAQSIGGGVSNPAAGPSLATLSAWPMNEGSGLVLNDVSGNANTANINLVTSVNWLTTPGIPGTVAAFTSSGFALASSTSLTNFDGTTPFTISAWILPLSVTSGTLITSIPSGGGQFQGWEIVWNGSPATFSFILSNAISTNWIAVQGSIPIPNGAGQQPTYVVATYDGSKTAAGVKLYVNGVLDTGVTVVGNNLTGSTANGLPARFGARNDGTSEYLGFECFSQIVNGVWSGTKIAANFALGPAIYTP